MSVVAHFLDWIGTARVQERASAAAALARAYVDGALRFDERCAAEAALTLLLDDPSSKVRLAMAEPLSMSRHAPPQIIAALAQDQTEIASLVLARSPLFTEADLIDRIATAAPAVQVIIASRGQIGISLSAAIAEVGEAPAVKTLIENCSAQIAPVTFRRLVERFGDDAGLRTSLLDSARLPSECRHALLIKLGEALGSSRLLQAVMGENRARLITRDACVSASVSLIETTPNAEHPALIEHLRLRGDLTAGLMVRAVASGKIEFFGAALVALTGQSDRHVYSLLARGRDTAIAALLRAAGFAAGLHAAILGALRVWRDVANGRRIAGPQEVSWAMLQALGSSDAGDLSMLLRRIHLEALRANARIHAKALVAAA